MRLPYIPILLLSLIPAPASAGWLCSVPIEAAGYRGYMARWIGHDGSPDDRIFIQLNAMPRPNETRLIGWRFADPLGYSLDPIAGPPENLPAPEQAFSAGPVVSVHYVWGSTAEGPIWAY